MFEHDPDVVATIVVERGGVTPCRLESRAPFFFGGEGCH